MTRLIEDWIRDIRTGIKASEQALFFKTGYDFISLAAAAGDVAKEKIIQASKNTKVGVIPITTGLGTIGSFSESVAAIVRCMNFDAFVTKGTDVEGIYEAHQNGAQILFLADDNRFIAINLDKNNVAENSLATAKGYVAALEGAVENLNNKEVLVIGCGVVGKEILHSLRLKGADIIAYDRDANVLEGLKQEGIRVLSDTDKLSAYPLVIDATSTGGWIKKGMLHPEVWFVTPGVPLSLTEEAYEYHKKRVIHDYLPIGVATMLAIACK